MPQPEKRVILVQPHSQDFRWGESANDNLTTAVFTLAGYVPDLVRLDFIADNGCHILEQAGNLENTLVAITGTTPMADRIQELIEQTVVSGGLAVAGGIDVSSRSRDYETYLSLVCQGASKGKASIAVGEIEGGSWSEVINDFLETGFINQRYQTFRTNLQNIPLPRVSIIDQVKQSRFWQRVSNSRGCTNWPPCSFCTIHTTAGKGLRVRPVEEMIAELELRGLLEKDNHQGVILTGDNFGRSQEDKHLLAEILKRKRGTFPFFAQVELSTLLDQELLDLISEFEAVQLGVGIESAFREKLASVKKGDIEGLDPVTIFHQVRSGRPNLSLFATFMLGFDFEPEDRFEKSLDFLTNLQPDVIYLNILTPYPATTERSNLITQGRLSNPNQWSNYTGKDLNFDPVFSREDGNLFPISATEFVTGFAWLRKELSEKMPAWSREWGGTSYPYLVI